MAILRTVPAVLASLLLAAHFLRAENLPLVVGCLLLAVAVAIPRPTVRLACRLLLAAGVPIWLLTAWRIAQARLDAGAPYVRMLVILGAVAAFTLLAAWLLPAGRRSASRRG